MRILQINANFGFSSTGVVVRDIGRTIEAHGGESYIAYQRALGNPLNAYRVGHPADWKVHALLCRLLGRQGAWSRLATKRLIAYIGDLKPDAVHLHNLHSNYVDVYSLLAFLAERDIATVLTMHDCWYFTGKCFHYVDCGCERFRTGCGSCPKRNAPPSSLWRDSSAQDWSLKNILLHSIPRLAVVGCSEWIAAEARKGFMADLDVLAIHNGVDTSIFKPYEDRSGLRARLGLPKDEFIVLGMANKWLQPRNAEAVSRLSSLSGVKVLLVYGGKSPREMAEYYAAADVFVNLTHADTLPTVNMESICCGTPVVTYDVGGSPELVCEKTGSVIQEDNIDALLAGVETLRHMRLPDCARIGKERFDRDTCYDRYLDVYERLRSLHKR